LARELHRQRKNFRRVFTSDLESEAKLRTAPLWGVRMRPRLMHDGTSLTFRDAILCHREEAGAVTRRFRRLTPSDQEAIITFLKSL